jgi:alpha-tubulin suppressor-like RCC1 family protein
MMSSKEASVLGQAAMLLKVSRSTLAVIACASTVVLGACSRPVLDTVATRGETTDIDAPDATTVPAPDAELFADSGNDASDSGGPPEASSGVVLEAAACAGDSCIGVVEIAVGGRHSCARLQNGHVRCWGANHSGELGTGTVIHQSPGFPPYVVPELIANPIEVPGISGATQLTLAGAPTSDIYSVYSFSCALLSDKVACWGSSVEGELGRGEVDGGVLHREAYPAPSPVLGLVAPARISSGHHQACAISEGGDLSCWGLLQLGEPGVHVPEPVELPAGAHALQASVGERISCVLLDDHSVACWGVDLEARYHDIARVPGLPRIAQVSAGETHRCTLSEAGEIHCWGHNGGGQLGHPTSEDGGPFEINPTLVALPDGKTALQVVAGSDSTCALLADRTVACWGDNIHGAVGTGAVDPVTGQTAPRFVAAPTMVQALRDVKQLAMGGDSQHICALTIGGDVLCWGEGEHGELGPNYVIQPQKGNAQVIPIPVPLR